MVDITESKRMNTNYSFFIYEFEGYKQCGKSTPCTFEEYFKKFNFEKCKYWSPTTSDLQKDDRVCIHRKLIDLKQIEERIEKGYIIVPFSNKIYLVDLLSYINLGLKICFMKTKTFKIFRKVYKDYI